LIIKKIEQSPESCERSVRINSQAAKGLIKEIIFPSSKSNTDEKNRSGLQKMRKTELKQ
jgi:hypothetical protein